MGNLGKQLASVEGASEGEGEGGAEEFSGGEGVVEEMAAEHVSLDLEEVADGGA